MNKMVKVSLAGLAAAAMIVPASVAFAQKTGPNFYGQVNYQLKMVDNGNTTTWANDSDASRFGVRGNFALDGGLSAIYQFETGFNYNGGNLASRDTFVGLEGGFGTMTFGRQANAYRQTAFTSNYVPTADEAFKTGGVSRQNNVIKYQNKMGDMTLAVSLMPIIGGETGDMDMAAGLSLPLDGGLSLGVGFLSTSELAVAADQVRGGFGAEETVIGVKAEYKADALTAALAIESLSEAEVTNVNIPVMFDLGGGLSVNAAVNLVMDDVEDPTNMLVGVAKNLGGGTTLHFHYQVMGATTAGADDVSTINFGIKHSF